ncbi:MAG: tRNA (adenosine(37)-N6)-dimethylallyltransferase MiaA [Bacteroidales bacterium]|nr:tRNA (adenosine(37)-N6)-dimethylallyltransferase MiaA [Bacteroidales bacterium]
MATSSTGRFLVVILGPTAVGKTSFAIHIARSLGAEIISADSRQFFRELRIGTAFPEETQLSAVAHHFAGHLSVTDYYNAWLYERDVIGFLEDYYKRCCYAVMTGGSGLYADAVCSGIDEMPGPVLHVRDQLDEILKEKGVTALATMLQALDPDYHRTVDKKNPSRLLRALEVCLSTGRPYSSFRKNQTARRFFRVIKIGLVLPREELNERIAKRVERMMEMGLLDEVARLKPYWKQNALKTVGYREIISYLQGQCSLDQAVSDIITHTRRYARRQMTWFRKDMDIKWLNPDQEAEAMEYIREQSINGDQEGMDQRELR